jgi:organic hydroperoxide reductase OsmC/OhrA
MALPPDEVFTTELIWDADMEGTAIPREVPLRAPALQVGPGAGWLPAHLMSLAAASCFMTTLLRLAGEADHQVLGFVSNSRLVVPADRTQPVVLTLTPCIVVQSADDAEPMRRLCEEAVRLSDVCRTVRHVQLEPEIQVVADAAKGLEP